MVLSNFDRQLLKRCLDRDDQAWGEFTDRYLGLVVHVIHHSASSRQISLTSDVRDDLVAEVFAVLVHNDFQILRKFRGASSLATYLTVVARRIVVRKLLQLKQPSPGALVSAEHIEDKHSQDPAIHVGNAEEVEQALESLGEEEAVAVRMFHLEGKSYNEISARIGMPENSVGPLLTRAREKMKRSIEASSSN